MRQMTEMAQWSKCLNEENDRNVSAKKKIMAQSKSCI